MDPVNFAPRVRQPVLMVNGREDFDLPFESAQLPLFTALGPPRPTSGTSFSMVVTSRHDRSRSTR